MKPFCANCQRYLVPEENGVLAVSMASHGPLECYAADLWRCPVCEAKIVYGFSPMPTAIGHDACRAEIENVAENSLRTIIYAFGSEKELSDWISGPLNV